MKNILMNTETTKAILDGSKVQFRIPICSDEELLSYEGDLNSSFFKEEHRDKHLFLTKDGEFSITQKYKIGETIWVREPFVIEGMRFNDDGTITHHDEPIIHYKADCKDLSWFNEWEDEVHVPWRGSMHMNFELARIFLKITNVRIERLQDISDDNVLSEGIINRSFNHAAFKEEDNRNSWIELWNKTAQKGYKWIDNPYLFVYEFEIDRVER